MEHPRIPICIYKILKVVILTCAANAFVCIAVVTCALIFPPRWSLMPDYEGMVHHRFGLHWTLTGVEEMEILHVNTVKLGWPLHCLARMDKHPPEANPPGGIWIHPPCLDERLLVERIEDYRPIWHGALGNAAIYTFVFWLSRWCICTMRKSFYIRNGRCPRCGYDLSYNSSILCPECGLRRNLE